MRFPLPLALTLAAALSLAACSSSSDSVEVNRSVTTSSASLENAEVDETLLPFSFQELPTYSLPFDDTPMALEGILFGLQQVDGVLQFTAVNETGSILWSTQRPATCSGFTLTYAGDTPIAVLTDVETTDDSLSAVTASAYDLHTGTPVWGPTQVAGPWHGPGTVFAQSAPPSAMGEVGPKMLLDPATGEQVDLPGEVIGEYEGTFVHHDGAHLIASGKSEWSTPVSELPFTGSLDAVEALPGQNAPAGYALLAESNSDTGALIDLSDSHVLTPRATSAAFDPAAEMIVAAEEHSLGGYNEQGPAWNRELGEGMKISASGGVLTYLRGADHVQVVNAVTGEDAVGYAPEATQYAIPVLITPAGAGVFSLPEMVLVATHQ